MQQAQRARRVIRATAVALLVTAIAGGCAVAGFLAVIIRQAQRELPKPVAVRADRLVQDAVIFDRSGKRFSTLRQGDAHRVVVPFDHVAPVLRDAVVASEDARFWHHQGLDLRGIARAFLANISNGGGSIQGGSTITQQLLKLTLLAGRPSLLRKLEEAMLASRLESLLTKEELLELYLNAVYFGSGNAGVEAAALDAFGHDASAVTTAEAALLAGAIPAPSAFHPFCAVERTRERQALVLRRLVAAGTITNADANAARARGVQFRLADARPDDADIVSAVDAIVASHAIATGDAVTSTIDLGFQRTAARALRAQLERYAHARGEHRGPRLVFDDAARTMWLHGLHALRDALTAWGTGVNELLVYDLRPVRAATPSPCRFGGTIFRHVESNGFASGIVIAHEHGGATLDLGDLTGTLDAKAIAWTKRSVDVVAPLGAVVDVRLPEVLPNTHGATVPVALIPRPLVEGAVVVLDPRTRELLAIVGGADQQRGAFDRARSASRPIGSTAKPFVFGSALAAGIVHTASEVHDVPYRYVDPWSGASWEPTNWYPDFLGTIPITEAVARSVNAVSVELTFALGVTPVAAFVEELSPMARVPAEPAIALGTIERTPLELANAFAVFASGGWSEAVRVVRSIERHDGRVSIAVARRDAILDPSLVAAVHRLLREPVTNPHGTAHALDDLGLDVRGKTGTTNDARDAWFVGYTPDVLVVVWVGYDRPRSLRVRSREESGASIAVPVAKDIFAYALADDRIGARAAPEVVDPVVGGIFGSGASPTVRAAFRKEDE